MDWKSHENDPPPPLWMFHCLQGLGARTRVVTPRETPHPVVEVMATGGIRTAGSDPQSSQFTTEELRGIVEVAAAHGLHVAAHAHGALGVASAVRAGCSTVEHCSWPAMPATLGKPIAAGRLQSYSEVADQMLATPGQVHSEPIELRQWRPIRTMFGPIWTTGG